MNYKNIIRIRKKLDKLDNVFLDKKRIKKILININLKSKRKKIDPKITQRIWRAMIGAYIDYEFRNFKKK